ncbi:acyltransferase family protein [Actinomadura sp. HBU206391]|uniref:acyltransferase family protein n=1 Tax=Actinomadura sp. HBU206391 TaxID=2731692 RepID=UPI00164EDEFD|nr:acyltransferase [Actinomadura sp. HBU206391]MBC6461259.1 acyltransferase [Actinomadura sp. HBU206391]
MGNASQLAVRTPPSRDRYVDFLRVFSLATVILGHWLMAVLLVGEDGGVTAGNALAIMPDLQPLTWLFQVMPLFFFVGGFSHAIALRKSGGSAEFIRARSARLLIPTVVFGAVWLALAVLIEATGHDQGVLRLATRGVAQPLWFIGVYLAIVAIAPAMMRLHRAYGALVPAVLLTGVVAADLTRFGLGITEAGHLNLLLVWAAVHQLGFFYADSRLGRGPACALAVGGLIAVAGLTAFGPYPVSMVGMPGERISNMSPPTLALTAHAAWLIGLALLLRGPLTRLLARHRVWVGVIAANGLAMTAFLWHLTALFLACAAQLALGLAQPSVGSLTWWLLRPVWLGLLALVTAGLIAVFRRADRPRRLAPAALGTGRSAAGVTLCLLGVLGFSAVGFGGALAGRTAHLMVLPVTPIGCALLLAAGGLMLGLAETSPVAALRSGRGRRSAGRRA